MLHNRDYTPIVDKSGSMGGADMIGGKIRWNAAREAALALASKCEEFDPDGITLYLFSDNFQRYDNVDFQKVEEIFINEKIGGGTNIAGVLKNAIDSYFERKASGHKKENGEAIFVITDGESDRNAINQVNFFYSNWQ